MKVKRIIRGNEKKVIGYVRVSTEDQNLGPEAQREVMERWCNVNGVELLSVFVDHGVGGGVEIDKRLELMKAIDALEDNEAGVLLVAKRDRLARDTMYAAMIERLVERKGGKVQSADGVGNGDTPEEMLMKGMIDCFAQYERAMIRGRTKAALGIKKSRGERLGQVPYGWKVGSDGVHLEKEENEQEVIKIVKELREEGISFNGICKMLEKMGIKPRGVVKAKSGDVVISRGVIKGSKGTWHPQMISNMVR